MCQSIFSLEFQGLVSPLHPTPEFILYPHRHPRIYTLINSFFHSFVYPVGQFCQLTLPPTSDTHSSDSNNLQLDSSVHAESPYQITALLRTTRPYFCHTYTAHHQWGWMNNIRVSFCAADGPRDTI